jgi:hypothetical protein
MSSGVDLLVQAAVGFGAAGIGAAVTWRVAKNQVAGLADAQVDAARRIREEERFTTDMNLLHSAREELRLNLREVTRHPINSRVPLATTFTGRLLISYRFGSIADDRTLVTEAFLVSERYNELIELVSSPESSIMWRTELETLSRNIDRDLTNAAGVLDRLLAFPLPSPLPPPSDPTT